MGKKLRTANKQIEALLTFARAAIHLPALGAVTAEDAASDSSLLAAIVDPHLQADLGTLLKMAEKKGNGV